MICYFLQLLTYFPGLIKRKYQLRTHFSLRVQSSHESWSTSSTTLQCSETLLEKSWNLQLPFPTFTTKTFHSKFQFFFFSTCVDDKISKSLMKEVVGGNLVGKKHYKLKRKRFDFKIDIQLIIRFKYEIMLLTEAWEFLIQLFYSASYLYM